MMPSRPAFSMPQPDGKTVKWGKVYDSVMSKIYNESAVRRMKDNDFANYQLAVKLLLTEALLERLPLNRIYPEDGVFINSESVLRHTLKGKIDSHGMMNLKSTPMLMLIANLLQRDLQIIARTSGRNKLDITSLVADTKEGHSDIGKVSLSEENNTLIEMALRNSVMMGAVKMCFMLGAPISAKASKGSPAEQEKRWCDVIDKLAQQNAGLPGSNAVKFAIQQSMREFPQIPTGRVE